jgi:hypothetical protein
MVQAQPTAFLLLEARRTGVLLAVRLLEPVVFPIQGNATHGRDQVPTEIASPTVRLVGG